MFASWHSKTNSFNFTFSLLIKKQYHFNPVYVQHPCNICYIITHNSTCVYIHLINPIIFSKCLCRNTKSTHKMCPWMQWLIYCTTPVRWLACSMTGSTSVPLRTTAYTSLTNFTSGSPSGQKEQKKNKNQFLSSKLHFDLESMCLGFQSMVDYKLLKVQNAVIKPAIVNRDCVQNHFCQVHSCNGRNDNPTFHQQQSTQNSIRLGQTTISPKSNASCSSTNNDTRLSIAGYQ